MELIHNSYLNQMIWHIQINGLLVEDEQELREQIPADLLENESNHNSLIADILEAAQSGRPTEVINQWTEREPGIMSMLDFVQPPRVVPERMELSQRPLDAQLANMAAQGLMSGLEDHVMFLDDSGFMVINEENPPSLEDAGEITKRLFLVTEAAEKLDEFGKWQRGSFLDSCETVYGDNFSVSQFVELSEKNYNTTITCLNTYRAFRQGRFENLSFTHHKEAHYTKLPRLNLNEEDRLALMRRLMTISNHFQLSCAEQRKLFSYANNYGIDNISEVEDLIDFENEMDADEALSAGMVIDRTNLVDRITVQESNRNYLFKFQRQWYHHRGVLEALPNGATDVFCTDDWRKVNANGSDDDIPAWTQTGIPAEEPNN